MRGGKFRRVAEETKVRLLREAVKLVGIDEVAQRLRTPANVVDLWTRGLATMPDRKVLLLADLLDRFGRPEK
jgi:hypothetical protein